MIPTMGEGAIKSWNLKIKKYDGVNKIREKMGNFTRLGMYEEIHMGFLELKNRVAGLKNSISGFNRKLETEKEKISELEGRFMRNLDLSRNSSLRIPYTISNSKRTLYLNAKIETINILKENM